MNYPNYANYEAMYKKYINKDNLNAMMDIAGKDYTGKKFLDICCGNGYATIEALKRGASFCGLIDQEKNMIPQHLQKAENTSCLIQSVNKALKTIIKHPYLSKEDKIFDIAFCRQAINYWLTLEESRSLSSLIRPGGVFIFNTFNTKPSTRARVKEYKIDGVYFTEISYLTSDCIVQHVQISEGYEPHLTQFKWISRKEFTQILNPFFNIEITTKNKTDIYKCIKK